MIDAWCTRAHYEAHLRPLWEALPAEQRGQWYGPTDDPEGAGRVLLAAAYRDLHYMRFRYDRLALVEHGIGQTYADDPANPGYPGGRAREPYSLLLAPGAHVVDPAAAEVALVGCPKLEPWLTGARGAPVAGRCAISFHWDCGICPEAGSTFWEFLPALEEQASQVGGLLVHAHPRIQDDVFEQIAGRWSLVACPSFDQILDEAAVYACDNSSTLFEFAATGRPVVVVNGARFRRGVEHGKRFWQWADIGEQISSPLELARALKQALASDAHAVRRGEVIASCYEGNTLNGVEALLRLCE